MITCKRCGKEYEGERCPACFSLFVIPGETKGFCKRCNIPITKEDATVCDECAYIIENLEATECPECQTKVSKYAYRCQTCGRPLKNFVPKSLIVLYWITMAFLLLSVIVCFSTSIFFVLPSLTLFIITDTAVLFLKKISAPNREEVTKDNTP